MGARKDHGARSRRHPATAYTIFPDKLEDCGEQARALAKDLAGREQAKRASADTDPARGRAVCATDEQI